MFWLVATGLVVLVAVPMVRVLLRADPSAAKAAELDISVYKDQLNEVERDLSRGVLGHEEAAAARTEVARRLLGADKRAQNEVSADVSSRTASLALIGVIAISLVGSVALYYSIGVPGMQDMPLQARLDTAKSARDARPDQLAAEAATPLVEIEVDPTHAALVEQLRTAVQSNPTDPTGLRLLVDNEARLGNLIAARTAQETLMQVLGETAKASDYLDLGEIMILAAGGYVSPQAEQALVQSLNRNPRAPRARYYSGLALAQTGRPDVAYRMWASLLQEGPPDAPWIPLIQAQIGQVAAAAGIQPAAPPPLPGPTSEDVESANQMSDEDRQNMIRGMVAGLAERLATDGGTSDEWARLIRAYGVLKETGKANEIWREAKETFANDPQAMNLLRAAAQAAEVLQ
jgi:cytochrome c-type biogenesis protein CcmH